jgi:hypothetical protein
MIYRASRCLRKAVPAVNSAFAPGVLLNNQRQATTTPPTLRLKTDDNHWTLSFPHDWFSQNALVLSTGTGTGILEAVGLATQSRRRAAPGVTHSIRPPDLPWQIFQRLPVCQSNTLQIIDTQRNHCAAYLFILDILRHDPHFFMRARWQIEATIW